MIPDGDDVSNALCRRRLLAAGGLAVALAGCVTDPEGSTDTPEADADTGDPEAVVERFFTALDDEDIERVNSLIHEDAPTDGIGEAVQEELRYVTFSIQGIETREETDERATVHVVYELTDEERGRTVDKEGTVELRTGDDGWRIVGIEPPIFGASVAQTAPSVSFSFDLRADGTLVITHSGGEAVSGDGAVAQIDGDRVDGVFEAGETYTAGDSVRVQPPGGEWNGQEVKIVWESGGRPRVLGSYTTPE
ncbi:hypothetical protein ACOZ4N_05775 [Halorientalis pallida]|uniref:hypothetical protein n=1 Tax=Halorientalis pallida TaxID=2479928 RepID=UPI003C6F1867